MYKIRKTCETETGDGKGFHYFRADQESIDDSIVCPTHPEANTRDFVIEEITE